MKAAKIEEPGKIVLEEIPVPEVLDDEVLVEVRYCGICGSDLHGFRFPGFMQVGAYMGHEFSGVVSKVGSKIKGWKPGDRVTVQPTYRCGKCWACLHGYTPCCEHQMDGGIGETADKSLPGAFSKFVRVQFPEKRLYSLPDEVSFEEGALVEPLACSLRAVRISTFKPGDYTMVLGAGPIGLGIITFLRAAGAGMIIVSEVDANRTALAKRFGADYVFNPQKTPNMKDEVLKLTGGVGVAQVFECTGIPEVFNSAFDFLRPWGQLMSVGLVMDEVPFVPFRCQPLEFQIGWSWCHGTDEFPIVIDYLRRGLPVKEMITAKIKLEDIVEKGFEALLKKGRDDIKILVSPD
ncbi:MAG: alcohol dehydrogenase catalytic domain-containing protein [Dehalococcoidales bacterium]|nr:alcohol dehydrogenase catalytic domain-containing protein [Dehalococcoidales bacterium]